MPTWRDEMSEMAVRVEGLGKEYRLGAQQERYSTLRDQVQKWTSLRGLLRRAKRAEQRPLFWALKDVSFEVPRGEVVGIIGRNGAGKSTLLKILSRITEPTEGEVDISGRVGSLLEVGTGFHPELTGRENVYLNGAILGMRRAEIMRKFDEIVAFAEVEKFIDTPVKHYSSGMYMRLAFAVAAHLEPEILIVDEVLAVGDAEFQKKCLGKMGDVARQGRTVLFVSHNMQAVATLCQRVMCLHQGKLKESGDPSRVITQYYRMTAPGEAAAAHEDRRTGSGEARYSSASTAKDLYRPHEDKVIRFGVRWRNPELSRLYLSALIKDERGEVIAQCDSRLTGLQVDRIQEFQGQLTLRTPWLKPGEYYVDLVLCSVGPGILDWFERACGFRVATILPYSCVVSAEATAMGSVLADFDWTIACSAQSERLPRIQELK